MSNLLKPISKSPGGGGSLRIPGLGRLPGLGGGSLKIPGLGKKSTQI